MSSNKNFTRTNVKMHRNTYDRKNTGTYIYQSLNSSTFDIRVVTASFKLLLLYLLKRFKATKYMDKNNFGNVISWGSTNWTKTMEIYKELSGLVYETAKNHSRSNSCVVLGCRLKQNDDGKEYSSSDWFHGTNKVPKHVFDTNTLILGEAKCIHLLHQICLRLAATHWKLELNKNCEHDIGVLNSFEEIHSYFTDLYNQAKEYQDIIDSNRQSIENDTTLQEISKKDQIAPTSSERQITNPSNTPPTVSKNTTPTMTYASVVSFNLPRLEVNKSDIRNDKIITENSSDELVDDPNAQEELQFLQEKDPQIFDSEPNTSIPNVQASQNRFPKWRKKSKSANDIMIDVSSEEPSEAVEILTSNKNHTDEKTDDLITTSNNISQTEVQSSNQEILTSDKSHTDEKTDVLITTTNNTSQSVVQSINLDNEMVQMPFLTMMNGKPTLTMVLLKKSDLTNFQVVSPFK